MPRCKLPACGKQFKGSYNAEFCSAGCAFDARLLASRAEEAALSAVPIGGYIRLTAGVGHCPCCGRRGCVQCGRGDNQ